MFGAGADSAPAGAVQSKSTPTDPVTVVDTETERLLRDRLGALRPGEPILGEEGGGPADATGRARRRGRWVVDPIDGTVNFVYGIPAYSVSVAAQVDGVSVAGAVADVVCRPSVFGRDRASARTCRRARRRDALRCTDVDDLSMALLGTGFGYSPRRRATQAALLAGCCRWSAMCAGSVLRRWICAWSRRAGWMRTTSTGCRCGTARRVR